MIEPFYQLGCPHCSTPVLLRQGCFTLTCPVCKKSLTAAPEKTKEFKKFSSPEELIRKLSGENNP